MAHHAHVGNRPSATATHAVRSFSGIRFDRALMFLNGLFIFGMFLDAWAHGHGRTDETFFTPWHAVLYSSFLALVTFFGLTIVRNRSHGVGWRAAVPAGYGTAFFGMVLFALGGMSDMVWHEVVGVEANIEAMMSPPHVTLMVGASLFLAGPLRAAWLRPDKKDNWSTLFPAIGSAAFLLALWSLVTAYAHPFVHPWAAASFHMSRSGFGQSLGVASIMWQTALVIGLALFLLRRWRLPFGAFALLLTFSAALVSGIGDQYRFVPVAFVAGLAMDVWVRRLQPTDVRDVRAFAFAAPIILWSCYFVALMLTGGVWCSIHLWAGSIVVAGVVGLLVSYLAVPPAIPPSEV